MQTIRGNVLDSLESHVLMFLHSLKQGAVSLRASTCIIDLYLLSLFSSSKYVASKFIHNRFKLQVVIFPKKIQILW